MRWLQSMFEDSKNPGHASSKRFVFVVAGVSLSISTISLCIAVLFGQPVDAFLMGAVTTPLAGLAGYSYVQGKRVERQGQQQ